MEQQNFLPVASITSGTAQGCGSMPDVSTLFRLTSFCGHETTRQHIVHDNKNNIASSSNCCFGGRLGGKNTFFKEGWGSQQSRNIYPITSANHISQTITNHSQKANNLVPITLVAQANLPHGWRIPFLDSERCPGFDIPCSVIND